MIKVIYKHELEPERNEELEFNSIKDNLHFSSEEQIKIKRKQWHLRFHGRNK